MQRVPLLWRAPTYTYDWVPDLNHSHALIHVDWRRDLWQIDLKRRTKSFTSCIIWGQRLSMYWEQVTVKLKKASATVANFP